MAAQGLGPGPVPVPLAALGDGGADLHLSSSLRRGHPLLYRESDHTPCGREEGGGKLSNYIASTPLSSSLPLFLSTSLLPSSSYPFHPLLPSHSLKSPKSCEYGIQAFR